MESAGAPGALPGTGMLQLHIPLLGSACPRSRGVRAQPLRHRRRACDTPFQVFVLKGVKEDRLQASFMATF